MITNNFLIGKGICQDCNKTGWVSSNPPHSPPLCEDCLAKRSRKENDKQK